MIGETKRAYALYQKLLSFAGPLQLYAEEIDATTGQHLGTSPDLHPPVPDRSRLHTHRDGDRQRLRPGGTMIEATARRAARRAAEPAHTERVITMVTDRDIRAAVYEKLVTDPLIDADDIVVEHRTVRRQGERS